MKRLLTALAALFAALMLRAQDDRFDALGAKLEEYFAALAGEPLSVQNAECDFLIESCQDSLVRQFVALKIYDHYLKSKIMGEDGVAVHVADTWFIPGRVAMHAELDLLNAKVFAEFNRQALLGADAPALTLQDPMGKEVTVPVDGRYTVIYFYDTSCSTCRIETPRLSKFLKETDFPLTAAAVYVGDDAESWEEYRSTSLAVPGMLHLWDPEFESDYQRKYGVLQTPRMFLVGPDGKIVGRAIDTPALQLLVEKFSGKESYVYGTREGMSVFEKVFAGYGEDLKPSDILDVAAYVLFIDKYILDAGDVWTAPEDTAQVLSLARTMKGLLERTPVGSAVPDWKVSGEMLRKPCLLRKAAKKGTFSLRKADYLVFYTQGCGRCEETLAAARRLADQGSKVLLMDMDALFTDRPDEARRLLDSFDLSALPYVMQLGPGGIVLHRYLEF